MSRLRLHCGFRALSKMGTASSFTYLGIQIADCYCNGVPRGIGPLRVHALACTYKMITK